MTLAALGALLTAALLHGAPIAAGLLAVTERPAGWPVSAVGLVLDTGDGCDGFAREWPSVTGSVDLTVPAGSTVSASGCATPANNALTAPLDVVAVNYTDTRVDQMVTFAGGSFPFGIPAQTWIWRTLNPDGSSQFRGFVAVSDLPQGTGSPSPPDSGTSTPTPTGTGTATATATPTLTPTPTDSPTATDPPANASGSIELDPGQYTALVVGLGMVVLLAAYRAVKGR